MIYIATRKKNMKKMSAFRSELLGEKNAEAVHWCLDGKIGMKRNPVHSL